MTDPRVHDTRRGSSDPGSDRRTRTRRSQPRGNGDERGTGNGGVGANERLAEEFDEAAAYEPLEAGDDSAVRIDVIDLKRRSIPELATLAEDLAVENAAGMRKQDLIFAILKAQTAKRGRIYFIPFASSITRAFPSRYRKSAT